MTKIRTKCKVCSLTFTSKGGFLHHCIRNHMQMVVDPKKEKKKWGRK